MKKWFVLILCLMSLSLAIQAQTECASTVFAALEQADRICQDVGRNQICYGNSQVTSVPAADVVDLIFNTPGNIENLSRIASFETVPYDASTGVWGVAILKVQGNLPDSTPGINATILVFGDVNIEPDRDDGTMQAFALNTGIGESGCSELPRSGIVIHTPDGIGQVEFTVNSVDIAMGSTLYLQSDEVMSIAVLEGQATVTSDGETQTVEAGEQVILPVDDDGQVSSPPPDPEPLTDDDVQGLPLSLLPVDIEVQTSSPAPTGRTYTVQPGDNLFRIALSCGITVDELAAANGITDPTQIYSGQVLVLPACNGQIFVPPRPPVSIPITPIVPDEPVVDTGCSPDTMNYCYAGQPWGDGRCDSDDPATRDYLYQQGWYQAALACGEIDSIPMSTGPFTGSCIIFADGVNEIDYDVTWSDAVAGQLGLYFSIDITRFSSTTNYAFTAQIGASDTQFSLSENRTHQAFEEGYVVITDRSGNWLTDPITCTD